MLKILIIKKSIDSIEIYMLEVIAIATVVYSVLLLLSIPFLKLCALPDSQYGGNTPQKTKLSLLHPDRDVCFKFCLLLTERRKLTKARLL